MAGYSGTDIKDYIERGLAEVGDLINRREYNQSVIKARKVAGSIISGYVAERDMQAGKLADTIEALYAGGAINMTSRDDFHSLRLYGSKAVHDRDCTEEDARNAYFYLSNEIQTYLSRKKVSVDRTPVRIDRSQISTGYGQRSSSAGSSSSGKKAGDGRSGSSGTRSSARRRRTSQAGVRTRKGSSSQRSTSSARRASSSSGRKSGDDGFGIMNIFKILIIIVVVILLVIIIRSLLPSSDPEVEVTPAVETTAPVETEPETEPETTTEPETEPEVYEYQIKGTNVNIRYADDQSRIYTQLQDGYVIGEITEIEDSDFVQFILDGMNVVVHSDYIEPVEEEEE